MVLSSSVSIILKSSTRVQFALCAIAAVSLKAPTASGQATPPPIDGIDTAYSGSISEATPLLNPTSSGFSSSGISSSSGSVCSGNGIESDNYLCRCYAGHAGLQCELSDATSCNGRGAVQPDGTCRCYADNRYRGESCEVFCATGANQVDSIPLVNFGRRIEWDGGTHPVKFGRCEGDCVTSDDCQPGLACRKSEFASKTRDLDLFEGLVPGCIGVGEKDGFETRGTNIAVGYCYDPFPGLILLSGSNDGGDSTGGYDETLNYGGAVDPVETTDHKGLLEACTGECDFDDDCAGDLKCFQRSLMFLNGIPQPVPIPGCYGNGDDVDAGPNWDYCYDPALLACTTDYEAHGDMPGDMFTSTNAPTSQPGAQDPLFGALGDGGDETTTHTPVAFGSNDCNNKTGSTDSTMHVVIAVLATIVLGILFMVFCAGCKQAGPMVNPADSTDFQNSSSLPMASSRRLSDVTEI